MSNFYKRLKSLRKEKNVNQMDLAELLNVTRATISAYETNKIMPPYDKIKILADYFCVSVEYLAGTSPMEEAHDADVDVSKILRDLLNQLNVNNDELTIDGVKLDAESKELLISSIENSLKMGKMLTKKNKD